MYHKGANPEFLFMKINLEMDQSNDHNVLAFSSLYYKSYFVDF